MARKSFSDQIRAAIRQSGLSQYAIWTACGIDKASMSRFMTGKGGLTLELLDRIADLIGMKVTLDPKQEVEHGKRRR